MYYANYLKYMERARSEWLRALGVEQDRLMEDQGLLFMVRSARLDYRRPARFNDRLEVHSEIVQQRPASIVFAQSIVRAAAEATVRVAAKSEPLCLGEVRIACVDTASGRPRPIPRFLLAELPGGC